MEIYLKEKISNPQLFTGRKKEIDYFMRWIEKTKIGTVKSTAILSRRKTGKSALMQRLYNMTFEKNAGIVPFYYEIKESAQWALEFSKDFFLEFIYQYIAFKTRKKKYISEDDKALDAALEIAKKEGIDHIIGSIKATIRYYTKERSVDILWNVVRDAPRKIAEHNDERIVQMIDEFQHLNEYIYRDKFCKYRIEDFVGSYFHTVEYRNAPLLVSGSWIGWLTRDLDRLLPGRVRKTKLLGMPEDESIEMILKHSYIFDIPVTEKTVQLMAGLTEGNPFYISAMFESDFEDKDFTTEKGLIDTIKFETENEAGAINGTWMEYVHSAIKRVNDINGKKIVLYLSKNRHREISIKEIMETLKLNISEQELEKKLYSLVQSDIIERGRSYYYYKGVQDNIFDKVFRSRYADFIEDFDPEETTNEYKELFNQLKKKYDSLSGEYNYYKGIFSEFVIINHLYHRAYRNQEQFKSMLKNLPKDFKFENYQSVWSYKASPMHKTDIQIDIFARAKQGYSLIGEVKNRKEKKFSKKELLEFEKKAKELTDIEGIDKALLFVFSAQGFTRATMDYMREKGIAWTKDKQWLEQ